MGGGVISIIHETIQDWDISRETLVEMLLLISSHELKEASTIIELALWKVMIGEMRGDNYDVKLKACRVEFPPAKEAVLQFYS